MVEKPSVNPRCYILVSTMTKLTIPRHLVEETSPERLLEWMRRFIGLEIDSVEIQDCEPLDVADEPATVIE